MQRQDLVPGQAHENAYSCRERWDDACNKTEDWWIAGQEDGRERERCVCVCCGTAKHVSTDMHSQK